MKEFARGDEVIVLDHRGESLLRRAWEDVGKGVLICTSDGLAEALRTGEEPNCVGFPKGDVFSAAEWEQQRRSFAWGNTHLHNSAITMAGINQAARELERKAGDAK